MLSRRTGGLHNDADAAGDFRFLRVVEEASPARPIQIERDRTGREALAEIVPKIVWSARRDRLGLVEIDEPLKGAHAGLGIERRTVFRIEIFAAFRDQHFIEASIDRLLLAGKLGAVKIRRIGEENRLIFHLLPRGGRREIVAIFLLESLILGVIGVVALEI